MASISIHEDNCCSCYEETCCFQSANHPDVVTICQIFCDNIDDKHLKYCCHHHHEVIIVLA